MLTITLVLKVRRKGTLSFINVSTPTFGNPMAFSIPDGVSHMRGGGFPVLDLRAIPFTMIAPILFRSQYFDISSPYPAVPEASMTGF